MDLQLHDNKFCIDVGAVIVFFLPQGHLEIWKILFYFVTLASGPKYIICLFQIAASRRDVSSVPEQFLAVSSRAAAVCHLHGGCWTGDTRQPYHLW